jgi:hypothetical protein
LIPTISITYGKIKCLITPLTSMGYLSFVQALEP